MGIEMIVGRKAIIEYLRSPLQLGFNQDNAWKKIKRWKRSWGLSICFHRLPNGSPYLIAGEVEMWLMKFDEKQKKRAMKTKSNLYLTDRED